MDESRYLEQIQDPRWEKKCFEIFDRDGWCCRLCDDDESPLHIHHVRCVCDKEPWDYPQEQLITLCESCHVAEHEAMPGAISNLIEQIKDSGFLSDGVMVITNAFKELTMPYPQDITAAIIEHAFSNSDIFKMLTDAYFGHIEREMQKSKRG